MWNGYKEYLVLLTVLPLLAAGPCQGAPASTETTPDFLQYSAAGIAALQRWYVEDTGLWRSTGWWNAANSVTVLVKYSQLSHSSAYLPAIANTFTRNSKSNFLNQYYDDEGWWALAWIAAYDLTHEARYLDMAETIFSDMTGGWDNTCGGGSWWNKDRKYKNAIPNELFLSIAAELASRSADAQKRAADLVWAQKEWAWFSQSRMINSQDLINDGLDANCRNNHQAVWSYNQGVILGGLVALWRKTQDWSLLQEAQTIALATISHQTDRNGILIDPCEPDCRDDALQFKGIFVRNLALLNSVAPLAQYKSFLSKMPEVSGIILAARKTSLARSGRVLSMPGMQQLRLRL